MKKILSFLIVLGAITFINFDVFSYTFNNQDSPSGITLDTAIIELNNYSLRDIFENSLVSQSDIFSEVDSIGTFNNGVYTNSSFGNSEYPYFSTFGLTINDLYYYRTNIKTLSTQTLEILMYRGVFNDVSILNPIQNIDYSLSAYGEAFYSYIRFYHSYPQALQGEEISIEMSEFYIVNLSSLGFVLSDLSKGQLDYYYTIYYLLKNGIDPTIIYTDYYTEGQVNGYDQGYDEGYNNGYDAGNLQGYNDGYDEGLFDYHTGNYYGQYDYTLSEPYDQATQANISLLNVFQMIIGVVMSMLGFIINIEMFGISIASILGTLAIGVSIIWLLKLIRG